MHLDLGPRKRKKKKRKEKTKLYMSLRQVQLVRTPSGQQHDATSRSYVYPRIQEYMKKDCRPFFILFF